MPELVDAVTKAFIHRFEKADLNNWLGFDEEESSYHPSDTCILLKQQADCLVILELSGQLTPSGDIMTPPYHDVFYETYLIGPDSTPDNWIPHSLTNGILDELSTRWQRLNGFLHKPTQASTHLMQNYPIHPDYSTPEHSSFLNAKRCILEKYPEDFWDSLIQDL